MKMYILRIIIFDRWKKSYEVNFINYENQETGSIYVDNFYFHNIEQQFNNTSMQIYL